MSVNTTTTDTYLPGHSRNATDFMARRSLDSHGDFFLPYLTTGHAVLDCGCGPGTITLGIAERVTPENGQTAAVHSSLKRGSRLLATSANKSFRVTLLRSIVTSGVQF